LIFQHNRLRAERIYFVTEKASTAALTSPPCREADVVADEHERISRRSIG
jgi:hypothetical protein